MTGKSARNPRLAPQLAGVLGGAVSCRKPGTDARGGAIRRHRRADEIRREQQRVPSVDPRTERRPRGGQAARPAVWKWAAAAVLLALGALCFPYAEAIVLKPFLERKLAALEADRGRLATIDQELDFLKYLKQNQPPYLDTIYLLAKSAPQGTRVEDLSMGRHQDISIRLKMANAQQVSDFRSKLIDSGWFANVMVEEQTPSPDRRVNVRMTAALKPIGIAQTAGRRNARQEKDEIRPRQRGAGLEPAAAAARDDAVPPAPGGPRPSDTRPHRRTGKARRRLRAARGASQEHPRPHT